LNKNFSDSEDMLADMIKYSYSEEYELDRALISQKEIIIYGIPYFYAVKVCKFETYNHLLYNLKN
jgi:hypothetical protein